MNDPSLKNKYVTKHVKKQTMIMFMSLKTKSLVVAFIHS